MKSAKTTVTLEDLLRIKRAEQPPAEFWTQFEQEMRAKQLAAIVAPRPWWAPFIRVGSRVSHLQLPVGAAAILAVSFITVREYRTPELNSIYVPSVAVTETTAESGADVFWQSTSSPQGSLAILPASAPLEIGSDVSEGYSDAILGNEAPEREQTSSLTALTREPSPSERYIAANLAAAQAADPGLMDDVFGSSLRHAQSRMPMRDPLTQVMAPGESRRSRLLATALPVSSNAGEITVAVSDRVSRSLTEERMHDSISRVGLKGDRVAIKF